MGKVTLKQDGKQATVTLEGNKLVIEMDAPEGLTMEKLNSMEANAEPNICSGCSNIWNATGSFFGA